MSEMITVEIDGTKHEVALPEGFVSNVSVAADFMKKDLFESEVGRRATSIADTKIADALKPEILMKDDSFVEGFIKSLGLVKPEKEDPNKPPVVHQPTAEQIASLQTDWRKAELDPINTKLTESTDRFGRLTSRMLESDIVQAAAVAGVRERLLKPSAEGQAPPIVAMLGQMFKYSAEHERHFVAKGDNFEITSDPKSTLPYKTPAEFVAAWAGLPENKDFVDTASRRGPGLDDPPGMTRSGNDVMLTQEQASDYDTYQKAEKAALDKGGRVIVTGTPLYGAAASAGGV